MGGTTDREGVMSWSFPTRCFTFFFFFFTPFPFPTFFQKPTTLGDTLISLLGLCSFQYNLYQFGLLLAITDLQGILYWFWKYCSNFILWIRIPIMMYEQYLLILADFREGLFKAALLDVAMLTFKSIFSADFLLEATRWWCHVGMQVYYGLAKFPLLTPKQHRVMVPCWPLCWASLAPAAQHESDNQGIVHLTPSSSTFSHHGCVLYSVFYIV